MVDCFTFYDLFFGTDDPVMHGSFWDLLRLWAVSQACPLRRVHIDRTVAVMKRIFDGLQL